MTAATGASRSPSSTTAWARSSTASTRPTPPRPTDQAIAPSSDADPYIPPSSYLDAEVFTGREYKTINWDQSTPAVAYRLVSQFFEKITVAPKIDFVYLKRSSHQLGTRVTSTTYQYNAGQQNGTQYGNLTDIFEWGDGDPDNPNNPWYRHTKRWYYPGTSAAKYVVGKVAAENLYAWDGTADGAVVRSTWYCYDGSYQWDNPIGSGQYGSDTSFRGRLTAIRRKLDFPNGGRCVDLTYGYDQHGNRTAETEYGNYGASGTDFTQGDARTTATAYETTYKTYPQTITNPLSQSESRTYDPKWGRPLSITDLNGGVTDYAYDVFGRLTQVQGPQVAGPSGNYRRTTKYTYPTGPATSAGGRKTALLKVEVRKDLGDVVAYRSSWRFTDGLGRVVQEYAEHDSGLVNVVNTKYDSRGLRWKVTVPHRVTVTGGTFLETDWTDETIKKTTTTYDILRRARVTTLPDDQTTEVTYEDRDYGTVDQNWHGRRYNKDAYGRVVKVTEYAGLYGSYAVYAETTYGHNVADQLLTVADQAGNQTSLTYDTLGRKTRQVDPDLGTWDYEYDPIGTLKNQKDAKLPRQPIDFFYDPLKRLVRTWYPAAWTDDQIVAGRAGRMCTT